MIRTKFAHAVTRDDTGCPDHVIDSARPPLDGEIARYKLYARDARHIIRNVRRYGSRSMTTAAWVIQEANPC